VSRITVLFAKFCGVILIHAVLLVIAAAVVYGFVMFQYARQNFSEEEKAQLDAEVFVARKSFSPIQPDMEDEVQKEVQKRIQDRINAGEKIDVADMTGALRRYIYDSVKKQVIQRHGDVKYDGEIFWEYEGLPEIEDDGVAYLRYKVFPDSSTPNQQVNTHGIFLANETIPQYAPGTEENKKPEIKDYITRIVRISNIEEIRTSRFNEYAYPAKTLIHDGKAKFGFINVNSEHKSVKFQNADGPFLLIPVGGFFINYVSAVLVIFLQIFILALISASV